ncbi:MAG: homoserine kinase [Bdellovibrionales bacterium]|nr:homoserine kinase [Bdellovibrionales bacterium]
MGNFSVAFDVLGVGLTNPFDRVIAEKQQETREVVITDITGDGGRLPRIASENTAGIAAEALLKATEAPFGVRLTLEKGISLGSGLGSSASSAVAALMAVNSMLQEPLSKEELVPFAVEAERAACGAAHADNVAPSLLGGVVLISTYNPLRVYKLPIVSELWVGALCPDIEVNTREARQVLPKEIPLSLASEQLGLFGGSLLGLLTNDPLLIESHLRDLLLEPHREQFIPHFRSHRDAALDAGAIAFGISGAGPTVFLLATNRENAQRASEAAQRSFENFGMSSYLAISPLLSEGASVRDLSCENSHDSVL